MYVIRLLLALALILGIASMPSTAAPTGSPSSAPTGSNGLPPDVDMKIMLIYVNQKPVGMSPIVRKGDTPLCPVRLAMALKFKVEYVPGSKIATLTKENGQTAVFKVGVASAVVKARNGAQRVVKMSVAPMILTPKLPHATDRMWIPLDTVVDMAGGKLVVEGRKIRITL